MEYKLLATAPSEQKIIEAISRFYCGSNVTLDGEKVFTGKGEQLGMRVIKKNGRYRFEMSI